MKDLILDFIGCALIFAAFVITYVILVPTY